MNVLSKPAIDRAVAALSSLLTQVSAITLKDISLGRPSLGSNVPPREIDILANVEVFGRVHTLACQISSGSDAVLVRTALEELRTNITDLPGSVTPVLILPVLSPEVMSLCVQDRAGCLDLSGNGRLNIGEVFVSMRSLPRHIFHRPVAESAMSSVVETNGKKRVVRAFTPILVDAARRSERSTGHARSRSR